MSDSALETAFGTALATDFLASTLSRYRQYDQLAIDAITQCEDVDLVREYAPGTNSIAVIVKHMRGNMRSRWTDFLTSDGEKPDRQRDQEFDEETAATREVVLQWWTEGYAVCLAAVAALRPNDLIRTVTIRSQPMSVVDALHRNLAHTAYHVGQIVMLAKTFRKATWRTLSIPRGGSEVFNRTLQDRR